MSFYCTNCGHQLPDNAAFCPKCGTARRSEPAAAPVEVTPPAPAPAAPVTPAAPQTPVTPAAPTASGGKPMANPRKLLIPVIAVVAVVAIVIAVMSMSGGGKGSYEDALDNYFDVHVLGKISRSSVKALAPAEYWEYMEDEEDESFSEYYAEIEEDLDDYLDDLEDQFGKNVKVTYEITDEKELSNRKLGYIAAYLDDEYGINEDDVTAAYELDLEYTVKGTEDDYKNEVEGAYVVKISGEWYVVSVDLDGEDTTVYFLT